ncbi:hypothetical protein JAAARDRAFT_184840 [Jaapia argillacea MUCL 33604]|uniref:BTB domain-containing protein n=1 Tax=Jaapia argillacea MUCL 33604 TaxID=933084 RepID=A0A067PCR0_9AGAM|nr:hypothetical protein JAAARDRAFT_184840 [Jaapia argillacea MUCL 33604]
MPTDQVLALIAPGNETTSDPSAAGPSGISATNPASSAWSTARRDGLEEEDPELQRALHESFFEDQELQRAIRESLALSNNSPDAGPSGASSSTMANTSSPSSAPPVPAASDSPNTESSANTPAVPPTDSATGAAPAVPASSVPSQNDDQPSIPDSQQGIYRRSSLSDIYMSRSPSPVLPELGDLLRGTPAPPTSSQPRPSLDKAPSQIPIVPNPARESESEADIPLASARLVILKSPPKKKVSTTPTAIPPISSQNGRERAQTRGRPPPPVSTDSRRPPSTTSQPKPKRKRSIPPASTNSFGLPPNKKSRLSNSSSRMTPRRSEKFWHLDGSVVVRVQDTLFKVHRSRLVYESEYFKKLFEGRGESRVGSGGEDEMDDLTKIDGCAVYEVDVEGLSVNDFEVLLSAMDEAITYVTRPPKFFVLLSILRAATHLDFEKYTSYAIFRLSSFLPSELHAMTELRMGIHPTWARQAVICCRLYRSARVFCDPCQDDKVVKGILKRAFYELARVSELGVSSTLPTPKRCLPANEKMMHWIGSVHTSGIFQKYIYDPICGLQALIDAAGEWEKEGYCYECVRTRIETWTDRRERLWDELEFWLLQWGPL